MSFEVAWRLTCVVFVVVALSGYILARKREREIERERERKLRELKSEMLKARDEYRALLKRYKEEIEVHYSKCIEERRNDKEQLN